MLDQRFRFGVEAGGRLVQDQDARVGQDRARNRNPLPLPAGKLYTALADDGVVLQLELLRELVHSRDGAGPQNLLLRRVGLGERHVLANRSVEQERILQHHAELRAVRLQPHRRQIDAIDQHLCRRSAYGRRRSIR